MLAFAALNVVLMGLFPPYDYLPPLTSSAPVFDGFHFLFDDSPGYRLNATFLQLELLVVALNAAIACFLLRSAEGGEAKWGTRWQRLVLWGVGLNLALVLLFPPMQYSHVGSRALIPSFDGFFFVLTEQGHRAIVGQLLFVECAFILVNGALLLLLFRRETEAEANARRAAAMLRMRRQT